MKNPTKNLKCDNDKCVDPDGEVRILSYGAGNLILCRTCFDHEIEWRKERNLELSFPFDLPEWNECKIYTGD